MAKRKPLPPVTAQQFYNMFVDMSEALRELTAKLPADEQLIILNGRWVNVDTLANTAINYTRRLRTKEEVIKSIQNYVHQTKDAQPFNAADHSAAVLAMMENVLYNPYNPTTRRTRKSG